MNDITKTRESKKENNMNNIAKILETDEGKTFALQVLSIIAGVATKNPKLVVAGMVCLTACYVSKNLPQVIIINNR